MCWHNQKWLNNPGLVYHNFGILKNHPDLSFKARIFKSFQPWIWLDEKGFKVLNLKEYFLQSTEFMFTQPTQISFWYPCQMACAGSSATRGQASGTNTETTDIYKGPVRRWMMKTVLCQCDAKSSPFGPCCDRACMYESCNICIGILGPLLFWLKRNAVDAITLDGTQF